MTDAPPMHPDLQRQPPVIERIAAVLPPVAASTYVADWPEEDEREWFRHGHWRSFSERAEQLDRIRRVKTARAVLAALTPCEERDSGGAQCSAYGPHDQHYVAKKTPAARAAQDAADPRCLDCGVRRASHWSGTGRFTPAEAPCFCY